MKLIQQKELSTACVGKNYNTNWFVGCLSLRYVSLAGTARHSSQCGRHGDSKDSCGLNKVKDGQEQHCYSKALSSALDECDMPDTRIMSNHLHNV